MPVVFVVTKKVAPKPAKQKRRKPKSQKRKLTEQRDKKAEHATRLSLYIARNSYSKTDHDAIF